MADLPGPDEIRIGPARPGWQRPPCRLAAVALAALMVAVIAVAALLTVGWFAGKGRKPGPARAPGAVAVTEMAHRLLGVTADWQVFGYGPNQVIRIQPARGRITRTAVPPLQSNGPVFFMAGPGRVIIRPLDFVPGYLVADGHPARILSGALSNGGIVIQGPRPGTVWWQAGNGSDSISLVWLDGSTTGVHMPLPAGAWVTTSDGRGDVLASSETGVLYDVYPGGFRRFTGALAAVGSTRWLMVDCSGAGQRSAGQADSGHSRCMDVVINLETGARRTLPGPPPDTAAVSGVIAPDGLVAAVFRSSGRQWGLHLVNLVSGADQRVGVRLAHGTPGLQTLAWSPDSRWLFVVAAHGTLAAVNTRTGQVQGFGVTLPPVSQIAVRG
jgi:hypothetical protein